SADGRRLVSASHDRTVRVWDARAAEGEPDPGCRTLKGHADDVNSVAFHPEDGRVLTSAGADGTVRLWDASSGKQLRVLYARAGIVEGLAFSPDGQRLATAGVDNTLKVWDTTTWQEIPPSPLAIDGGVRSVAFSPDGRLLAAAGYTKNPLIVWDVAN